MLKTKKEKTMFNLKNVSKMKNLKVMMMTLMMCLMTMFIVSCNQNDTSTKNQSQSDNLRQKQIEDSLNVVKQKQIEYSYKNEMLVTTQRAGAGVEKDMVFLLSSKEYDNIKNSELFIKWEERTFSNPKNEVYINKHKDWDKVILYINSQIRMSLLDVTYKLENGIGLDFIDGSKGMIYLKEKGEIKILYYFKAQNSYGNYITRLCSYLISLKDGEEKTDCYIY